MEVMEEGNLLSCLQDREIEHFGVTMAKPFCSGSLSSTGFTFRTQLLPIKKMCLNWTRVALNWCDHVTKQSFLAVIAVLFY
jgi:hypothetical protein